MGGVVPGQSQPGKSDGAMGPRPLSTKTSSADRANPTDEGNYFLTVVAPLD
jgi:hypothetical protein